MSRQTEPLTVRCSERVKADVAAELASKDKMTVINGKPVVTSESTSVEK
jgi:hypothetical protein